MTRAEQTITTHIGNMNGATNPAIAHMATNYAVITCKHVFKKWTRTNRNYPGHYILK